jgi:hypothetical protein
MVGRDFAGEVVEVGKEATGQYSNILSKTLCGNVFLLCITLKLFLISASSLLFFSV